MRLAFDIQWHYALDIAEESDVLKYISPKTLWNMRRIVTENKLEDIIFKQPTERLSEVFNVIMRKQRIDSVHIKSNMRNLSRIGILSKGISRFLVNVKRHYKEEFDRVEEEIRKRYLSKEGLQSFGMVKPSEARKRLKSTAEDLFDLVEHFKGDEDIEKMSSYKLLCRILKEHCNIEEVGAGKRIELKEAKEISSSSVQNPSDPDAGYSGHKGKGYSVQIMETYSRTEGKEEKEKRLNLITYVEVESADKSDAKALMSAIEKAEENNFKPEEVLADSLYGSDENCEKAKERNVEIISPVMGKNKKEGYHISEFLFTEEGKILECPEGENPVFNKRNKDRYSSGFGSRICGCCCMVDKCCVKKGKNYYYVRYTEKDIRIRKRREKEASIEFKDKYRFRAGVEATMSELDRKTGIKHFKGARVKSGEVLCVFKSSCYKHIQSDCREKSRKPPKSRGKRSIFCFFCIYFEFKKAF